MKTVLFNLLVSSLTTLAIFPIFIGFSIFYNQLSNIEGFYSITSIEFLIIFLVSTIIGLCNSTKDTISLAGKMTFGLLMLTSSLKNLIFSSPIGGTNPFNSYFAILCPLLLAFLTLGLHLYQYHLKKERRSYWTTI